MESIRIYCGHDAREAIGFHVCLQSIIERTESQVEIIPLTERLGRRLGVGTDGTNAFTKTRFLIPYLCGYRGWALFIDCADMLLLSDISELWSLRDNSFDVMVVKHEYSTKHPIKYLGQSNLDYPCKNWSSVMLMNCANYPWRKITPEYVNKATGQHLHRFEFLKPDRIGDLPVEWNHLVGEYEFNPEAKLAHYTVGLPAWRRYADWDYSTEWAEAKRSMNHIEAWEDSFDDSVKVSER
jgi:lipopolysaccharide biosynthesis glycosyltransferase